MKSKTPKTKKTKNALPPGWVRIRTKKQKDELATYLFNYAVKEKLAVRFHGKYAGMNKAKGLDLEEFQSILNYVLVQVINNAVSYGRYKKAEIHGALLKHYRHRILSHIDKLYTNKRKDQGVFNHESIDELNFDKDKRGKLNAIIEEMSAYAGDEELTNPEDAYIRRHEQLGLETFLKEYQARQNARFGSAIVDASKKNRTYDFYMAIRGGMKATEIQDLLSLSEHHFKTTKHELQEVLSSYQEQQQALEAA